MEKVAWSYVIPLDGIVVYKSVSVSNGDMTLMPVIFSKEVWPLYQTVLVQGVASVPVNPN